MSRLAAINLSLLSAVLADITRRSLPSRVLYCLSRRHWSTCERSASNSANDPYPCLMVLYCTGHIPIPMAWIKVNIHKDLTVTCIATVKVRKRAFYGLGSCKTVGLRRSLLRGNFFCLNFYFLEIPTLCGHCTHSAYLSWTTRYQHDRTCRDTTCSTTMTRRISLSCGHGNCYITATIRSY